MNTDVINNHDVLVKKLNDKHEKDTASSEKLSLQIQEVVSSQKA
jgi:hypothetical protein